MIIQFLQTFGPCYAAAEGTMHIKVIGILILWNLLLYQGSCTALEKISQHPANILYDYLSYHQIAIVHFSVPENTIFAVFK